MTISSLITRLTNCSLVLGERWQRLPANIRGALLVSLGGLLLVGMTGLVKTLGRNLPSIQIVFFRCLVGFFILFLFHGRKGFKSISTRRPFLHFLRSAVGISAMSCMFYSVTSIPLAEATAILFSRSLFMIVLAFLFLKEIVNWRVAVAIISGFLGVMIMTRPGSESFQPAALVAAGGSFLAALVVIVIKKLAKTERTVVIMFYYTLWTTVLSAIPAAVVWQAPTWKELTLLLSVGLVGVAGQTLVTHGFILGQATVVMPFDYLRLVYASFFGIFFFSELPDIWSITGSALIIGSNLYILMTNRAVSSRHKKNVS